MNVKYLKKTSVDYFHYYIIIKVTFLKNNTCDQKKKNAKFSYKPYYIFIQMLGYEQNHH
jgi:hypothetical protein